MVLKNLCVIVLWTKVALPLEGIILPIVLYTKQNNNVSSTNAVSQSWVSTTVDRPRNMNMTVSLMLASIFMKYLMVVCDFCEMLYSTYFFMDSPQDTIL